MKLITKTQRVYLILIIGLLVVWSIIFLLFTSFILDEKMDETLAEELHHTHLKLQQQDLVRMESSLLEEIKPIASITHSQPIFSDTLIIDHLDEDRDLEEYRQLKADTLINGKPIQITLRKSKVEYDDLFEAILITEVIFVGLLIVGISLANRKILLHMWQPFHDTLYKVMNYQLSNTTPLSLVQTDIDEFQKLNKVIEEMVGRIEQEFNSLKKFTENASHEIQTPLSVIQNRIELLLQDESLTKQQRASLQSSYEATGRLSRLNKALLLLAKIENEQYSSNTKLSLSDLLAHLVTEYRELSDSHNIKIEDQLSTNVTLAMNAELAEVMFRNLLSNAIKHHKGSGPIQINLNEKEFSISNPGKEPMVSPEKLFDRFQKGTGDIDSLGLGLSIVRAIVKTAKLPISYHFESGIHTIKVSFPEGG